MDGSSAVKICPKCGAPIKTVGVQFERHSIGSKDLEVCNVKLLTLLDNVRSLYNVGSIFRTADAAGISKIYLCGITPSPDNPRMEKTAIGAQHITPWQHSNNGLDIALYLKNQGHRLWAIEGGEQSKSLFETIPPSLEQPIVLVFGNELAGIDPDIISICERILHIPMGGSKESLNVTVAFGITVYFLRYLLQFR